MKWVQTPRFRWALLTFLLITLALCPSECFVPMIIIPTVVLGSRLTTVSRQQATRSMIKKALIATLPGCLAVMSYIVLYLVYRIANPSTYDGNRLSFNLSKLLMAWFQATVTPLPGWIFRRSNSFIFDAPSIWNKLAVFASGQPLYLFKAIPPRLLPARSSGPPAPSAALPRLYAEQSQPSLDSLQFPAKGCAHHARQPLLPKKECVY
jgi:hypothetical protein